MLALNAHSRSIQAKRTPGQRRRKRLALLFPLPCILCCAAQCNLSFFFLCFSKHHAMFKMQSVPVHVTLHYITHYNIAFHTKVSEEEKQQHILMSRGPRWCRGSCTNALHTPVLIVERLSILQHKLTLSMNLT